MGLLTPILRPKAINTEMERLIREVMGGGSSSSGISVNSESAMRQLTVYACVKVLYQSIAQMPCHFMVEQNKIKDKAINHNLYRILHDQPNRWMTAPEFWGMTVAHVSLRGDFLAFKVKVGNQVRELLPIDPSRVSEIVQNSDWSLTYKISTVDARDGKTGPARDYRDYSQDEIFHIRGLSLNGYSGLNPIQYARESVGIGLASERFIAQYFGKGLHPGAIIEYPQSLDPITHKNLWEAYKIKYSGLSAAQDLMLLDNGMKIQFPSIKLVDQQFLELGKFTQSQIAGLFRVPLMLLQAGDAPTTYASSEQFMLAFVTHALTPIVVNIEKAIYRDLLTEEEKKKYYAKFSMEGLLRGAFKERTEGFATLIDKEVLNPNEVRDMLDLNPYEGGNEYRTRTSSLKEQDKQAPAKGDTLK